MKSGFLATIVLALVSTVPVSVWAQVGTAKKAVQPGIYSNVRTSSDGDHLGGIEVEIQDGPANILDITICESWCNSVDTVVYEDNGDWIGFQVTERVDQIRKFRIGQRGKDVIIEEDKEFAVVKARLKRQKETFGLFIARGQ